MSQRKHPLQIKYNSQNKEKKKVQNVTDYSRKKTILIPNNPHKLHLFYSHTPFAVTVCQQVNDRLEHEANATAPCSSTD